MNAELKYRPDSDTPDRNPFVVTRTDSEVVTPDLSRILAGAQKIRDGFTREDREKIAKAKVLVFDPDVTDQSKVRNIHPNAYTKLKVLHESATRPTTIDLAVLIAGLIRGKLNDLAMNEFMLRMQKLIGMQEKRWFTDLRKAVQSILSSAVRAEAKGGVTNVVGLDSFMDQVTYATGRIDAVNRAAASPVYYRFGGKISTMENGGSQVGEIKQLSFPEFVARFNFTAPFQKPFGETGFVGVSAPMDVCTQVFNHPALKLPEIERFVRAPVYTANAALIMQEGYHPSHKLYFAKPDTLILRNVPNKIGPNELREAITRLTDLFADFYLDGVSRSELEAASLTGQRPRGKAGPKRWGSSIDAFGRVGTLVPPSFLHCIGFLLEQFVRPMIDGSVMPLLVSKTVEGAGGGLLVKIMMTIIQGGGAPQVLSMQEVERVKAIFAMLAAGRNVIGWDNLPKGIKIDSKAMATLFTEPEWTDRILSKSEERTFPVTASFVMVGVNPLFTKELVRRLSLVSMVPQTASPESRDDFAHPDLMAHVRENRSTYINALLVLVKNWLDLGRPAPKHAPVVGSYNNYRKVIAGILEAASPHWTSWQSNRDVLNGVAKDEDEDEGAESFFENWAGHFEVGKPVETSKLCDLALAKKIPLPVKRALNGEEFDYSAKGMGKFLAGMQGRFFKLDDGTEVQPVRADKRGDNGRPWVLQVRK